MQVLIREVFSYNLRVLIEKQQVYTLENVLVIPNMNEKLVDHQCTLHCTNNFMIKLHKQLRFTKIDLKPMNFGDISNYNYAKLFNDRVACIIASLQK